MRRAAAVVAGLALGLLALLALQDCPPTGAGRSDPDVAAGGSRAAHSVAAMPSPPAVATAPAAPAPAAGPEEGGSAPPDAHAALQARGRVVVLAGRVVDAATGAGVRGARVDAARAAETTDAEGRYRLVTPDDVTGEVIVRVHASGFGRISLAVRLPSGHDAPPVVELPAVRLRPGCGLRVRVLRPDGAPVADADVDVWGSGVSVEGSTDDAGRFEASDLPEGPFTVEADDGTEVRGQVLVVRGRTNDLTLVLPREARLRVRAADERGAAVPSFRLWLRGPDGWSEWTGANEGVVAISEPAWPEPVRCLLLAEGSWAHLELRLAPGATERTVVLAPFGERLVGRIRRTDGRPLDMPVEVHAFFGARWDGPAGVTLASADVDPSGAFELVAPRVPLKLWAPRLGLYLEVADPGAGPVELVVPTACVRGRVRGPDGQPLAGAHVTLISAGNLSLSEPVDAEGAFSFEKVPGGAGHVAARHPGRGLVALEPVDVPVAGTREVDLVARPGARARARLLLPDGAPARDVEVRLFLRAVFARRPSTTDAQGSLAWDDLYDGTWRVEVEADALATIAARLGAKRVVLDVAPVVVSGGRDVDLGDLRLRAD